MPSDSPSGSPKSGESSSPTSSGPSSGPLTSRPPSIDKKKTPKRDYAKEAADLISEMRIRETVTGQLAANMAPGTFGYPLRLQTNAFGIVLKGESTIYPYDVHIYGVMLQENNSDKIIEFSKKGKDDYLVNERKRKCVQVIKKLVEVYPESFPSVYQLFYDGQAELFTLYNILADNEKSKQFPLPGNSIDEEMTLSEIRVEIEAAKKGPFNLSAFDMVTKTANLDIEANECRIPHFLEIVLNQNAIMNPDRHKTFERGKTFMIRPLAEGLQEADIKHVGDGKQLLVGTQKSIYQIEGPRGRGTCNSAIVIDAKKAAFHIEQDLAEKAADIIGQRNGSHPLENAITDGQRERIQGVIRGLFVETLHLMNNKRLQVFAVSKQSAVESFFMKNDQRISVYDYYAAQYKFNLKYPNAPVILAREKGQMNCYPMEVLKVASFQRVTIPQQTAEQSKLSTKECAVPPLVRQRLIMAGAEALGIVNPENEYLRSAKIRMLYAPIKAPGRKLPDPTIVYRNDKREAADGGKWKMQKYQYLVPAKLEKWALFAFFDYHSSRKFTLEDMRTFAVKFTEEARRKGMMATLPMEVAIAKEQNVEEKLAVAANHKCTYALCVVADIFVNVHKNLKYYERMYDIVTQQVQLSTVLNVMTGKKFLTLENILNKTNCKNGGLNYGIDLTQMNGIAQKWITNDRLYVGIHLAYPPRRAFGSDEPERPVVIGYAANMKENPLDIVGDFMLQQRRNTDLLPSISEIITQVIGRHKVAKKGKLCQELVIYRSNVDEGAFKNIITSEIPFFKACLKKQGYEKIKLVFIIVSKAHNVRLMRDVIDPKLRLHDQNLPAGIVCDTQIAHPAQKEFYLNSHTTIQGSSRTPKYTVLYDEIGLSSDEMEGMTWALAHGHQIVSLTTSLPANLYIAERYAERGASVYASYQDKGTTTTGSSSGLDDANRILCYHTSAMWDWRVNA